MRIHEVEEDDELIRACWWLQRWVSGSMGDPDWAEGEEWANMPFEQAFPIIQRLVGNKRSVGMPLWRSIGVPRNKVKTLTALGPHEYPFQSFTVSRELAMTVGEELERPGVQVVVSVNIPPADVMFGMADLRASRKYEVKSALSGLEDWYYQREVIARVTKPLPLLTKEVIRR